jgi:hypothetical protein
MTEQKSSIFFEVANLLQHFRPVFYLDATRDQAFVPKIYESQEGIGFIKPP